MTTTLTARQSFGRARALVVGSASAANHAGNESAAAIAMCAADAGTPTTGMKPWLGDDAQGLGFGSTYATKRNTVRITPGRLDGMT